MEAEKYTPTTVTVGTLLNNIQNNVIAIPEIQRPFVWEKVQVRDLLDSLYKGFPTGYLIIWQSPNVKLKDGSFSTGKKILIDGQQRVTALMTSLAGKQVINKEYKKDRIKIAFNPFEALSEDKDAEIFAVQTPAHLKDKKWIRDVAEVFDEKTFNEWTFINKYCQNNPDMKPEDLNKIISRLKGISQRSLGVIDLAANLDIDVVTDIFIRINSKGTALSQGDFVMSKIAADETYGGNVLRKIIDYFAHLCVAPNFYDTIAENDEEFVKTEYFKKLKWLKNDTETVYDPDCDDVLRVAFMHMYPRAKLADLVSLLSGRDFETREFKNEIIEETYKKLYEGVLNVVNENNFKQFMLAIRGAGFISEKLINSKMALDFAYTLFLRLQISKEVPVGEIKRAVQKWYVLSVLTGRYSASPESAFYKDIRSINEVGVIKTLKNIEAATLSDNFWQVALTQNLAYTSTKNPTYIVYLAAQVTLKDMSLLSNNISVEDLIIIQGDVHHIFPKAYLKRNNFSKNLYNQDANYAFLDTQVNKSISDRSPKEYFAEAIKQCETKKAVCGSIIDLDQLKENLVANCIPWEATTWESENFDEFLEKRRVLMAAKIRKYYESL